MRQFYFGERSRARLATCHPALVRVAERAIEITPIDFAIIHGFRDEDLQNTLFESGASKVRWPFSQHNNLRGSEPCALAFDFAPWVNDDIDWSDNLIFAKLAGVIFAAGIECKVELRWGGDWDRDASTRDQRYMDLGHIELFSED